ncbi:NAD(P)-dependent oxidoreductase [uncultured Chryseobacterium sp.]|uniref:NAD-dependent epimerase/dehydratase family protein n=1 Tax=uncultured Chryseobacterium sp. TaxID=259322 RepID=UPI0025EAC54D|nr:NAD-dependent epimerase/dehydratase family protein [uncultured Chryseobacterium sp.]
MKNILITGGAGFIGSNIALKLVNKGFNVTVLDNLSPQIHGTDPKCTSPLYKSIINKVKFIEGSVTSRKDWEKALDHQDAVIHLAAETGTGQSMYQIQHYIDVNIGGTAIMLDILANDTHHIKKVIIASSRAIYGEGKYYCGKHGIVYPTEREDRDLKNRDFSCKCPVCKENVELLPTSEDSKIHPTSVYGITKQNQEQMVLTVCKSLNIAAVSYRYQNVYGPGQSLTNPYTGILSIFSTRIKNDNAINIFEDGKETRDFVFIEDVAKATILGLEKDNANGQVYNVGTGVATDVMTVANTLAKYYQHEVSIQISGNYRLGDIRHNFADISKINRELGFTPEWSFEQGIRAFTEWVNQQEIPDDKYELSIAEMQNKGLYK